ncbi:hypothetical protein ACJX0J_013364 [Zea mays]
MENLVMKQEGAGKQIYVEKSLKSPCFKGWNFLVLYFGIFFDAPLIMLCFVITTLHRTSDKFFTLGVSSKGTFWKWLENLKEMKQWMMLIVALMRMMREPRVNYSANMHLNFDIMFLEFIHLLDIKGKMKDTIKGKLIQELGLLRGNHLQHP